MYSYLGVLSRHGGIQDDISGMVNYALTFEQGTAITRSRQIVRKWIKEHIVFKVGTPPIAARRYAYQLIRLCLARGTRLIKKIMALRMLPNGDWRNQTAVEIYMPEGSSFDEEAMADVVADGVCLVCLGERIKKIYVERWHGSDLAWDQFIRMEGICALASNTLPDFLMLLTGKRVRPIVEGLARSLQVPLTGPSK